MRTDVAVDAKTQPVLVETLDENGKVLATWTYRPSDPPTAMHIGAHAVRITHLPPEVGGEPAPAAGSGTTYDETVIEKARAQDDAG